MNNSFARRAAALMVATAMVVPAVAMASPAHKKGGSHEAELEARLKKLEQEVTDLRDALKTAHADCHVAHKDALTIINDLKSLK